MTSSINRYDFWPISVNVRIVKKMSYVIETILNYYAFIFCVLDSIHIGGAQIDLRIIYYIHKYINCASHCHCTSTVQHIRTWNVYIYYFIIIIIHTAILQCVHKGVEKSRYINMYNLISKSFIHSPEPSVSGWTFSFSVR